MYDSLLRTTKSAHHRKIFHFRNFHSKSSNLINMSQTPSLATIFKLGLTKNADWGGPDSEVIEHKPKIIQILN